MVVNLVGVFKETNDQLFEGVNAHGARKIALYSREQHVGRLVHVSSMSASPDSPSVQAQSKAIGEVLVRGSFHTATVVRPSLIFGLDGNFFNLLGDIGRYTPAIPLYGGGKALVQPVFVGDVSAAIIRILEDPATEGEVYELGGPRTMTMREIYSMELQRVGRQRPIVPMPMWIAEAQATLLSWLPNPPVTWEQIDYLERHNIVGGHALSLTDLGITPTPIEDVIADPSAREYAQTGFKLKH